MILTDREIRISIKTGQVTIDPAPDLKAFSSTSVDLTLSANLNIFKSVTPGVEQIVDPSADGYSFFEAIKHLSNRELIGSDGFRLEPHMMVLGWTAERIELPHHSRIAARVEGKSSLARLGLGVHITAPTIHAGFSGPIQLEIVNHGVLPVRLRSGMPICQLIFEITLGVPDKGYDGQFLNQAAK